MTVNNDDLNKLLIAATKKPDDKLANWLVYIGFITVIGMVATLSWFIRIA